MAPVAGFALESPRADADAEPTGAPALAEVETPADADAAGRAPAAEPPVETPTEAPPLAGTVVGAGGSAKPKAATARVVAKEATRRRWLRIVKVPDVNDRDRARQP
jgi:hypothetical protein